jgi:uncharacterized repeat protein (TIGR03803 family)
MLPVKRAYIILFFLSVFAALSAQAQTETVLYNFCSVPSCKDGSFPTSTLTRDSGGNFYGTTPSGGAFNAGAVFELSPSGGGWTESVLYSFTGGTDGSDPISYLTFDSAGNLYGTTYFGGDYECDNGYGNGCGVVFELSPVGPSWAETVLHSFTFKGDGGSPEGGIIFDSKGNLYGGNVQGVFELSPSGGGWNAQLIYEGLITEGGVTMDVAGNLFGGIYNQQHKTGAVFELSPSGGNWKSTVLHNFIDDNYPTGTFVFDSTGNLYGTTSGDPCCGEGTVYKLTAAKNGKWTERTLYPFKGTANGRQPFAGVVFDAAGNIYGTTIYGGQYGMGTVFELVRVGKTGYGYKEKVLWSFNGTDGSEPNGGLLLDSAGNLYGTTSQGGSYGAGVVFEVMP